MKIILTCLVCALCLGVLVRLDVTMLSGHAQAFFQETVAPVLHMETTDSKLRDFFVPVLADLETDTTGNRWDKVAVSTGMDTETAFSCETGSEETETTTEVVTVASDGDAETAETMVQPLSIPAGITYSMEQLNNYDFLVGNCYTIDSSTNVTAEELAADTLLSEDLHIDPASGEYKVLIYHTHGSETFADSRPGVIEDTVIGLGDELTRILEEDYGIPVYHDRTVYDVVDGVEDRSLAYDYASDGIDAILQQYLSIEVVLDIHRDGVREDVRLVRDIDGVPTAQIMFLNGMSRTNENGEIDYLYNPYRQENLAFSLQMHLAGKELYGDLMRRIYVRGYCFNLNKMPRSSLIEVGAQTNTVAEAKNAMVPLGAILYKVLIAQE